MKTLFVRNLPFDASETELRKAFEAIGTVHRCSIAKNRETGESRGFGFVDMEDDAAARAIAELNGTMISNRTIVVQESDPKSRTGSAGAGGSSSPSRPMGPSSRPLGSSGPPRPHGSGGAREPMPSSRAASPPANRNFGPPASPAAERNRVYKDRKDDRLKPYKRDQFDFRSALDEDEEDRGGRRRPGDRDPDDEG